MIVKLLTEHHLEFLSAKGGCTGSYESIFVKMSNCWKSHAAAHILISVVFQDLLAYCDRLQEQKADKDYVQMEVDVVS